MYFNNILRCIGRGCRGQIYNYLCNQCLKQLKFNETGRHDITEISLKVALSTINQT